MKVFDIAKIKKNQAGLKPEWVDVRDDSSEAIKLRDLFNLRNTDESIEYKIFSWLDEDDIRRDYFYNNTKEGTRGLRFAEVDSMGCLDCQAYIPSSFANLYEGHCHGLISPLCERYFKEV